MTKAKYPVNLKAAVDFQKKMFPAERLLFHCIDALESLEKAGNVPRNNAEPFIHELLDHYQERMLAQMPENLGELGLLVRAYTTDEIWREIKINCGESLGTLAETILESYGIQPDYHPWCFYIGRKRREKLYLYSTGNESLLDRGDIYADGCTLWGQGLKKNKVFYLDVTGHLDDVMMCKVMDYVYPYHDEPVVTDKKGNSPW